MDSRTRQLVRQWANNLCEYCQLPDSADVWHFHVDHILARVHGGDDDLSNLSWSCTQCNVHKSSNFAGTDPQGGERVNLFDPRRDVWHDHFKLDAEGYIVGRTPIGRATARLLDMNGIPQFHLRRQLIEQGEFDVG